MEGEKERRIALIDVPLKRQKKLYQPKLVSSPPPYTPTASPQSFTPTASPLSIPPLLYSFSPIFFYSQKNCMKTFKALFNKGIYFPMYVHIF